MMCLYRHMLVYIHICIYVRICICVCTVVANNVHHGLLHESQLTAQVSGRSRHAKERSGRVPCIHGSPGIEAVVFGGSCFGETF